MKRLYLSFVRYALCFAAGTTMACATSDGEDQAEDQAQNDETGDNTTATGSGSSTLTTDANDESTTEMDESSTIGSEDTSTSDSPKECWYGAIPTIIVSEDISEDTTWSGIVRVEESIKVLNDAVLTIAPGTQIFVNIDREIEFAWNGAVATLFANGTEDMPILFCGAVAGPGTWKGLVLESNTTSNSTLHHVAIDGAGMSGPALELNASISINNVSVNNSANDGVWATDFANPSTALNIANSMGIALVLTDSRAISNLPLDSVFSENVHNIIALRFSEIDTDTVFRRFDIPYQQEERIDVIGDITITYEEGVQYQFSADTDIEYGWNGSTTTVVVQGSLQNPVVFSGIEDNAGWWRGLVFGPNVRTNSRLSYLEMRNAGGVGSSAMDISAAIELNNIKLSNNAKGIRVSAKGLAPASTGISIAETLSVPVTLESEAWASLPKEGSYNGNTQDWIIVQGGSIRQSGTVSAHNIPYRIIGNLDILEDVVLTIEAGTQIQMSTDADIEVGWNGGKAGIQATGTADRPIVIQGVEATPGFWKGITIGENVLSTSAIQHLKISDGGFDGVGLIDLHSAISIKNTTFANSAGYGIRHTVDDTTDYTVDNTFLNNALGNTGTL